MVCQIYLFLENKFPTIGFSSNKHTYSRGSVSSQRPRRGLPQMIWSILVLEGSYVGERG